MKRFFDRTLTGLIREPVKIIPYAGQVELQLTDMLHRPKVFFGIIVGLVVH